MQQTTSEGVTDATEAINRAFSRQSVLYDEHDRRNQILIDMRDQVYRHIGLFLKPHSHVLELNAGTGIDASYLANAGHTVFATDLSDGMVNEIQKKVGHGISGITAKKLSFTRLDQLDAGPFDYVFSNFGGLNCIDDLTMVSRHLPALLRPGGFLSWVIMPPICPWELAGLAAGHGKKAFRRLRKEGTIAHLENEGFPTFYHSVRDVRRALGPSFHLISSEGLCAVSPPPHRADFPVRYKSLYRALRFTDRCVRSFFPFNRCADHVIMTFRYAVR